MMTIQSISRESACYPLGVQSWSAFVTQKSVHIWQIWPEMTKKAMPESLKLAQIHLIARLRFRPISPNLRQIRRISENPCDLCNCYRMVASLLVAAVVPAFLRRFLRCRITRLSVPSLNMFPTTLRIFLRYFQPQEGNSDFPDF